MFLLLLPLAADAQNTPDSSIPTAPWLDVTNSTYGAQCDGASDDTAAIQAALTAANTNHGGTVLIPAGKTCLVSSLNMNGFMDVTLRGGLGVAAQANNRQATINFTGTCSSEACLLMQKTQAVSIYNLQLKFPNATNGPLMNVTGAKTEGIYGNTFVGPNTAVGPILLDQSTNNFFVVQNNFSFASIYIEGPVDNRATYSDNTVIEKNHFHPAPGTMTIANASVAWTIKENVFQLYANGNSCVPAIGSVNGFTNQQNLMVGPGNVFNVAGPCTKAISLVNFPAVTGNFGGGSVIGNLFIGGTSTSNQTLLNIQSGQSVDIRGNNFEFALNGVSIVPNVQLTLGANQWYKVSNFLSGTPAGGCVTAPSNTTSCYGSLATVAPPVAAGPLPTLTGTGACATITAQKGGSWAGEAICTGPTGPSTIVIAPGITAPNALQCHGSDATHALAGAQSAISASSCTLSFAIVSANDTITFAVTSY